MSPKHVNKAKQKKPVSTPKSFDAPEEMQQWCALLAQELVTWPQVESRKMFGMTSFYRKDVIFAAVPGKKAYFSPYSIIFKLQEPSSTQRKKMQDDPRIHLSFGIGQKWYGYELGAAADIRGALEWFDLAFQGAKTSPAAKKKRAV